ncbi:hypothetical protein M601_021420 [Cellulophaga baltica 4]|nr:hypothetical protein M601_021420 [Cellulophaga baltica 4]
MDTEKYIASGILELYVAGILSEVENLDVARYAAEYPEIQNEIKAIEATVLALTKAAAPKEGAQIHLAKVQAKIAATGAPKSNYTATRENKLECLHRVGSIYFISRWPILDVHPK